MKKSKKATSIVESIVVLLIVVTGITGVYNIMHSGQQLARSSGNRVEAIQIARDGIEAMINIRDTNWLKFPDSYENCWNTLNYDARCISNSSSTDKIKTNTSYIVYKDANHKFQLTEKNPYGKDYTNEVYRTDFSVKKDNKGLYTQGSNGSVYGVGTTPFYTREIIIQQSDAEKITIQSKVSWGRGGNSIPQKVVLTTSLRNWKSKQ